MLAREGEPVELFNLESDLYEQRNLLKERPEIVQELTKELQAWLAEPRRPFGDVPD